MEIYHTIQGININYDINYENIRRTPLHFVHGDKNMIPWLLSSECKESYFTNSML